MNEIDCPGVRTEIQDPQGKRKIKVEFAAVDATSGCLLEKLLKENDGVTGPFNNVQCSRCGRVLNADVSNTRAPWPREYTKGGVPDFLR